MRARLISRPDQPDAMRPIAECKLTALKASGRLGGESELSMAKDPDPTKDPKFQQVIKTFLSTPPKRHEDDKESGKRPVKASGRKDAVPKPDTGRKK